MKKIAVILFSVMIAACNSAPKKDDSQTSQPETNHAGTASSTSPNQNQTQDNGLAKDHSIYFDYAKAVVAPAYHESIQSEAHLIKGDRSKVVTVEGNCDERGSAEYNLGLGQRRADAVKKLLVAAGVPGNQIKAASLGKEKPRLTCHEEKCWKENRRADFVQGS